MKLHEALIIIRDEQGGKGSVERTSALFGHFEIDGDIITHVVGEYSGPADPYVADILADDWNVMRERT
jgi:hypothetical protein